MAIVPRPPKARGNTSYHLEVLAGKPDILDTEIDDDFDKVYNNVNGLLDDSNIVAGANIDYSKLNLHGRIQPGDLTVPFNFPATAQVSPHSIGPTQLWSPAAANSGVITTVNPGPFVTSVGNISLYASVQSGTPAFADNNAIADLAEAEGVVVEVAWTTRGGPIVGLAQTRMELRAVNTGVGGGGNITVIIYELGNPGAADGNVLWTQGASMLVLPGAVTIPVFGPVPTKTPVTFVFPISVGLRTPGSYRLKMSIQHNSTTCFVQHRVSSIAVVELA